MRLNRHLATAFAGIGLFTSSLAMRPAAAQAISDSALQQIRALLQEKASRTAAQQKLGSQLVYAVKTAAGQQIAPGLPALRGAFDALSVNAQGGILVDIRGSVSSALLTSITQAGGAVLYSSAARGTVHARLPLLAISPLAARSDVIQIKPAARPKLHRVRPLPVRGLRRPSEMLPFQLSRFLGLSFFIGSVTTQGVITHAATSAMQTYGVNGSGVRVGVLSDSAEAVPFLITTGDLPPGTTIVQEISSDQAPGSSEGSAMMEIIHDMAPGAQLFFASAYNGDQSFADNILTLRNTYGCDIIVDDVSYSEEGVFQDSDIALAVDAVTASGALYFSSAGNSGNLTSGTSGTWEGDFNAGAGNPALPGYILHAFTTGQLFNALPIGASDIVLEWSDPLGGSTNDYDLFVLNPAGTAVVDFSTLPQTGTQDPIEEVYSQSGYDPGSLVVIAASAGVQRRALHLDTFGSLLSIATDGNTHGHNGGPATTSIAAVAWNSARGALRAFPGGALNPTENFSSDGPRRMFYNPNGTPITPGNLLFSTAGGRLYNKPDLSAADGITARTPGFSPFFGTSAASPHAAAIAALVKSANPALTGTQIYNAMISGTIDIRAPGLDRDAGYGIVMADKAVANAKK